MEINDSSKLSNKAETKLIECDMWHRVEGIVVANSPTASIPRHVSKSNIVGKSGPGESSKLRHKTHLVFDNKSIHCFLVCLGGIKNLQSADKSGPVPKPKGAIPMSKNWGATDSSTRCHKTETTTSNTVVVCFLA